MFERTRTRSRDVMPVRLPIFPTPRLAGVGFKPEHFDDILRDQNKAGFFEVHAEHYMGKGGAPHAELDRLRQDYPVFVHGAGLSIGGPSPPDKDHLGRFKAVVVRYEPQIVSEHLACSTHNERDYNDLLPVPYDTDTLERAVSHVNAVQDALGRFILLENPSTYVAFESSAMRETEFIGEITRRTGCGLLLDINNVFVSATNHDYAPDAYLADLPMDRVGEIHLAGHAMEEDDGGLPLLIDAHDRTVASQVWELFEKAIAARGLLPTLIEWDNDVPEWPVLKSEAEKANAILSRYATSAHPELLRRAN